MNLKILLLILAAQLCVLLTQLLFKKGVDQIPDQDLRKWQEFLPFFKNIFKSPMILCGIVIFILGIVIWVGVLTGLPLNVAYCLESSQYVFIVIASRIFLGERINAKRIGGTLLIMLGILCVIISQ